MSWRARPPARGGRRPGRAGPLAVEQLEDRCLLSTLQAISLAPANQPPSDTAAGVSILPSVSADGRYVAFQSSAPNLVPGQTGGQLGSTNVFLRDRSTGAVTLVSHVPGFAAKVSSLGDSINPVVSRDGRYVAYTTNASEIVNDRDTQFHILTDNVVVYDVATGTNTLVSHVATSPTTPDENEPSAVDAISSNGRYILFDSYTNDLVPGQVGPSSITLDQLYLYDQTGTTYLVSHAAGQTNVASNGGVGYADSVADDGLVAYESQATNLAGTASSANVYLYNPSTQTNQLLSTVSSAPAVGNDSSYNPLISGDGSAVVYLSLASDVVPGQTGPASVINVFRYDAASGKTTLVSGAFGSPTATGNADSGQPLALAVSRDGQSIAFASQASDLVPGQSGATGNVFLYNAQSPGLRLLSGVRGSTTVGAGGTLESLQTIGIPATTVTGTTNGDGAQTLALSDDGSLVAYVSQASDVVPGQTTTGPTGTDNVFLFNRSTGQDSLVSGVSGSPTATANAASGLPVLSGDGSLLAFDSLAFNLSAGVFDANGVADVLTYTPGSSGTTLVSRVAFPQRAPGSSYSFSTSADGRYTVFTSTATNLVVNQVTVNSYPNVFLYDRDTGTVTLVNHLPGFPSTTGDGGIGAFGAPVTFRPPAYLAPSVSADGNWVVFTSQDDNLVPGETRPAGVTGFTQSVYRYNVQTGQVTLVSHAPGSDTTLTGSGLAYSPVVSADGRSVAYVFGDAANYLSFSEGGLALYDSDADTTTTVVPLNSLGAGSASVPVISDDGNFVAYESQGNVYVFDRTTAHTALVSHAAGAPGTAGNGTSSGAVLSHDGSSIAFVSAATNLVSGQATGSFTNVFLYNVASGAVRLGSGAGGSATVGGNGNSDSPAIDADGSYVAYRSDASNLVGGLTAGSNVYEFNTQAQTQTLVSHQAGSLTAGAGGASEPVLDDDGHLVSYVSTGGDLVPGESGPAGVKNVFVWLRQTNANILASGQGGSPTVGGDADSDFPLLTRHSFPGFSSKGQLLPGLGGSSVAYINTLVALSLSAAVVADGSPAGSVVGTLSVSSLLAGQYLPPKYSLPLGQGDNAAFGLGSAAGAVPLVIEVPAHYAGQSSYQVLVHVDVGFGDDSELLQVTVAPPSGGGGGGPASRGGVTARLVPVRVGKKKKARLMLEVFDADTGALEVSFAAPFQGPGFKHLQVSVRGGNQVVVTARKGTKTKTQTFPI